MAKRGPKPGSHHRRPPAAGRGRTKGVPNKATLAAREAIARFVDDNAPRMQDWLDTIARSRKWGPKVAMDCMIALLEYHVPKLQRTEMVGDPNQPIAIAAIRAEELAKLNDPVTSAATYQELIGAIH